MYKTLDFTNDFENNGHKKKTAVLTVNHMI